jgi:hypothetical protein
VKEKLRAALRRTRQGVKIGKIIRSAITRGGSAPSIEGLLGYTMAELTVDLERQFGRGMSWGKFKQGLIHIDHIVPMTAFDLSDPMEIARAFAMTNLRPLWKKDNIEKGDRRFHLL